MSANSPVRVVDLSIELYSTPTMDIEMNLKGERLEVDRNQLDHYVQQYWAMPTTPTSGPFFFNYALFTALIEFPDIIPPSLFGRKILFKDTVFHSPRLDMRREGLGGPVYPGASQVSFLEVDEVGRCGARGFETLSVDRYAPGELYSYS